MVYVAPTPFWTISYAIQGFFVKAQIVPRTQAGEYHMIGLASRPPI